MLPVVGFDELLDVQPNQQVAVVQDVSLVQVKYGHLELVTWLCQLVTLFHQ
jgi:hypothetical protein